MRTSHLIWKRNEMKLYRQTRFLIIFLYNGRNEIKLYSQSKTDENKSSNRRRFLLVTIQMPHEPPFFPYRVEITLCRTNRLTTDLTGSLQLGATSSSTSSSKMRTVRAENIGGHRRVSSSLEKLLETEEKIGNACVAISIRIN